MRLLLLTIALLLPACHKGGSASEPTATGTTTGTTTAGDSQTAPGAGAAAGDLTCTSDADCVVSCARPSECCDQLCPPCEQVFRRDALAKLQEWRTQSCASVDCPMAKCMAPKEETIARCTNGQCAIERVPVTNP